MIQVGLEATLTTFWQLLMQPLASVTVTSMVTVVGSVAV